MATFDNSKIKFIRGVEADLDSVAIVDGQVLVVIDEDNEAFFVHTDVGTRRLPFDAFTVAQAIEYINTTAVEPLEDLLQRLLDGEFTETDRDLLQKLIGQIDDLEERIGKVELSVEELQTIKAEMQDDVQALKEGLEALEEDVTDILLVLDDLEEKIATLEYETFELVSAVWDALMELLEQWFGDVWNVLPIDLQARLTNLQNQINAINNTLAIRESRFPVITHVEWHHSVWTTDRGIEGYPYGTIGASLVNTDINTVMLLIDEASLPIAQEAGIAPFGRIDAFWGEGSNGVRFYAKRQPMAIIRGKLVQMISNNHQRTVATTNAPQEGETPTLNEVLQAGNEADRDIILERPFHPDTVGMIGPGTCVVRTRLDDVNAETHLEVLGQNSGVRIVASTGWNSISMSTFGQPFQPVLTNNTLTLREGANSIASIDSQRGFRDHNTPLLSGFSGTVAQNNQRALTEEQAARARADDRLRVYSKQEVDDKLSSVGGAGEVATRVVTSTTGGSHFMHLVRYPSGLVTTHFRTSTAIDGASLFWSLPAGFNSHRDSAATCMLASTASLQNRELGLVNILAWENAVSVGREHPNSLNGMLAVGQVFWHTQSAMPTSLHAIVEMQEINGEMVAVETEMTKAEFDAYVTELNERQAEAQRQAELEAIQPLAESLEPIEYQEPIEPKKKPKKKTTRY